MKKVLLLGDSIRMGYGGFVRDALQNEAEVCYPDENCCYTQHTFVKLAGWIGKTDEPEKIAVIHWNNGHWDAAHWDRAEQSLNSPEQYAVMLKRIGERLRKYCPKAVIVFALTTPIREQPDQGNNPRTTAEIIRYNEAARQVMAGLDIPVNDLFATAAEFPPEYYVDYAHFTAEGYRLLARAVTAEIRKNLQPDR